ncbi:hypothetical protein D1F64_14460 [Breoghania sp. L-A4]|nr:hypothetical protein D1F64_14460 [Breoghania sp. L-A4]
MPGLPSVLAAEASHLDEDGRMQALFLPLKSVWGYDTGRRQRGPRRPARWG